MHWSFFSTFISFIGARVDFDWTATRIQFRVNGVPCLSICADFFAERTSFIPLEIATLVYSYSLAKIDGSIHVQRMTNEKGERFLFLSSLNHHDERTDTLLPFLSSSGDLSNKQKRRINFAKDSISPVASIADILAMNYNDS